jgi:hypothetical protein
MKGSEVQAKCGSNHGLAARCGGTESAWQNGDVGIKKLSVELRNKPRLSIRNSTMRSSFLRIQHSVHDSIIIPKNTSTSSPEMLKAGVCQAAMPGNVMSKASPEHLNMAAMKPGTPAKLSRTIKRHSTALTWESLAGTTHI